MLSPLRNRFGIPGVISVVALVFAMLGGAYAAQSSDDGKATASAKAKRGPKGPKGATGPAGPAGPAGPQGPAGANGKDGSNGANGATGATGATGANGTSVTNTALFPEDPNCPEGGAKFTVGAGAPTYACNGEDGEGGGGGGGLPDTLGSGESETGAWLIHGPDSLVSVISFPIPLSKEDAEDIEVWRSTEPTAPCTGTLEQPTAPPGAICFYVADASFGGHEPLVYSFTFAAQKTISASGALLIGSDLDSEEEFVAGSWAVTAP